MVEDEFHFLLKCPLYSDIRHHFIDNIQRNCDNFHHLSEIFFLWILTNEDNTILLKLCDFLLKGFNLRTVTSILPTGYTLYWFKVTIILYYSLFYQLEYIYICK